MNRYESDYNGDPLYTDEGQYVLYKDVEKLEQRVKELEGKFKHYHVNLFAGTDECKKCGLDLRDPIHLRVEV